MYIRLTITFLIGIIFILNPVHAQNDGATMFHDFDNVGDISSLRTDQAAFKLMNEGRTGRGQALRITFNSVSADQQVNFVLVQGNPALIFERDSLTSQDFSEVSSIGFWVKNESDRSTYLSVSVRDLDGKQSRVSPSRIYVSPGVWRHIVYRLELQELDRQRIGSISLINHSDERELSILVDDMVLLSPMAAKIASLENAIQGNLERSKEAAQRTGLEAFIETDVEHVTRHLHNAASLPASERLPTLAQLARETAILAGAIEYRPVQRGDPHNYLRLTGRHITDAWLAACAPMIADAEYVLLNDTSITDTGLSHLHSLEHLSVLVLGSPGITGAGLKGFSATDLVRVDFLGSGVSDAGLESITAFPQLEVVNLDHTKVTDVGVRHLAGLQKLRFLYLRGTGITSDGLSHFHSHPAMEWFDLRETPVMTLAPLGELRDLKHLFLSESMVDDAGLAGLKAFPKLERLFLAKTHIFGSGLSALKDAKQLRHLDLNGTHVNDAALSGLIELPRLSRLELSGTRITDSTLNRIASANRLNYLDIYGTNVTGDGIKRLGILKGLSELYAGGTAADDASIHALAGLDALFHLDLQGTRITDASFETIGTFKHLNSLNLSRTGVTGSSISKLSGIEELRTLNLAGTLITDEGLDVITQILVRPVNFDNGSGGGLAWLNHLMLTDTHVSDEGLKNIWRLKHLFTLHLEGTKIGDKSMEQIALLPDLQDLRLDGTIVSDTGIAALSNSPNLRILGLKGTRITDEAINRIGNSIQELALSHTGVTDIGVGRLNSKAGIRSLELAGTAVTDAGLEGITGLSNLRELDLAATSVTDQGVDTLKTIPTLSELRLDRTSITDQAAESILRFGTLKKVSLNDTRITADGKALLERRRPGLNVDLDVPWVDGIWNTKVSKGKSPWTSSVLSEELNVTDLDQRSNIRSMSLQHRNIDVKTLVALRNLPSLESLDLADTSIDDSLLSHLVGFPQLRALRLSRTAVTDDGLRHLSGLKQLEHLHLDGTQITGSGLQHLTELSSLRTIELRETLMSDEHAEHLAALKSLRKISVTNTRIGDVGLSTLEGLSDLRYLDLFGTDVTDAGLQSVGRMSSLSHLYLSATSITGDGLAQLKGLEEIVELGIDHNEITDDGLEHLTGFRYLERLRLDRTPITDAGIKTISNITALRKLELNGTTLTDRSIDYLLKLTHLESLDLNGSGLGDRGLGELVSLESLEHLSVADTDVSLVGIESFKSHRPDVALIHASNPPEFSWFGVSLCVLYGFIAFAICLYGLHRYLLVWLFARRRDVRNSQPPTSRFKELPSVTIQIPMFNECNVAERIIAAVCAMDYPRDRLQIQVLDDSTDGCTEIVRKCCERYQGEGIQIVCHHRETRDGFKSGALAAGLETATGELVAIFDADFVPAPDFLQRAVHYFTDEKVGVVQAEWRHLNRDESTLTQCQAMFLNGHFLMEQAVRSRTGRWFNFNGTAGIWRRSCIEQSGGWCADTLTEDTDLSYRAQLDGWEFVYLPDVQVDAELPSTMSAFLSQQHRWTRGLLQCAMKLLPLIFRSKTPLHIKAEAWFHLTTPILYAVMFLLSVLAIPATFVAVPLSDLRGPEAWVLGSAVLIGGTMAAAVFYSIAERVAGQSRWRTLLRLPALMALGIGSSVVNTRAAVGAFLGVRSPFIRTPKFGGRSDSEIDPSARRGWLRTSTGLIELLISGVLLACLFLGIRNEFALIGTPFLVLFAAGFLWVGGARFVEARSRSSHTGTVRMRALRWSAAASITMMVATVFFATSSLSRTPLEPEVTSRVAGIDLAQADWMIRGSGVTGTESRPDGLVLDVDLDPDTGTREEGEIFVDLVGPLASVGNSISDSHELVFDIVYPRNFSGELQAFVSDTEGKSQYGTIAFVERHDALRVLRVSIAPSSLTPAMGYTDPDFDAKRSVRRVGLKISAQSDRVRGHGYRPFQGELTIAGARVIPRNDSTLPEIQTISNDEIYQPQPMSWDDFVASSGADRPWPLGYAFSGPLSQEQRNVLDQTYGGLNRHGLGFTRVYIGDYRTGLIFDDRGAVSGIESQFLDYLDDLAQIANRNGITVMFSMMDNTMMDGKGVDFPQFVVDRKESDRFVTHVLFPMVEKLSGRQVIWDLFNEPENAAGVELSKVQDFVDRALTALRPIDSEAKFTVVSRSARELVYWRGRGLDVLSHNIFDQEGLTAAFNLTSSTKVDAPVWIAEMDPDLADETALEALRLAGYRGVGIWGWDTRDKYHWNDDEFDKMAAKFLPTSEQDSMR